MRRRRETHILGLATGTCLLLSCCNTCSAFSFRTEPRKERNTDFGAAVLRGGLSLVTAVSVVTVPIRIEVQTTSPLPSIVWSQATAITESQRQVQDVWFSVSSQFYDQSFNGLGDEGWRQKERDALKEVEDLGPEDDELVTSAINKMLSYLGDPFTRYLPPAKFETITNYATGKATAGVGVQLLEDPRTKNVRVMAVSKGSPAESSGIEIDDAILGIDGESVEGMTSDYVASKCRGNPGERVEFKITRIDGRDKEIEKTITVTRQRIKQAEVEASTYVSNSGKKIGLIKVPSFSTETEKKLVEALRTISSDGNADSVVFDLRGNVGGYMPAGVNSAKLFLPSRAHIIAEVNGAMKITPYDADSIGADLSLPIFILVDKQTASASEIFTAALQDNRRATVVGKTNTYGKGKIQNVQSLSNGSGVAVTRARYITPSGRDLNGVGITPNRSPDKCDSIDSAQTCLADII